MPKVSKNNDGTYNLDFGNNNQLPYRHTYGMSKQEIIIFFNTHYGSRNNAHNEINRLNKE